MRVVLLGEHRADRMVPPFRRAGAEVVVLGFVDLDAFLGPGAVCGKLPPELTDAGLLSLLCEYDADLAVANMGQIGQERLLPVYARVGATWRSTGHRMLAHSEDFAWLATDKVWLHSVARQRHWPAPRGVVCDAPAALLAAAGSIGLPTVVKEACSEPFAGRHYVADSQSLQQVCREVRYPVVVQEAVEGEEFGVELLTTPSGTVIWPVASMGRLDGDCAPGKRVRVAPAPLPDQAHEELLKVVQDIVDAFGPAGPWQLDFAVGDDGRLHLIEINGRLSGMTNLSWTSTDVDPHAAHVAAALGQPPPPCRAERVALELPVRNEAVLPPVPAGVELRPFPGNPANRGPLHLGYYRAVLGVPADREDRAREWLLSVPEELLLASPRMALDQLTRGMLALKQGGSAVTSC
ncbi:ATP-grasp domain-containing protein [Streptomyces sp. NPDC056149]|uniref:ATP-binding protein n=1 Tax=Streptomyces sp. NPDC056149 TaxID=3345728 RepID=UPI0035DC61AE